MLKRILIKLGMSLCCFVETLANDAIRRSLALRDHVILFQVAYVA